ncbi:MAG: hypothetical protein BM557_08940, partial [Flavobacterium sp. MedPE-SWcel]
MAQAPGCPDVTVASIGALCDPGDCTTLSASYFETGGTESYEVSSVPYAPPYSFIGGTQVSVNTDDVWSGAIPLPFDFCFYGNNYTNAYVGSNGVVGFNTVGEGSNCPWSFNQTIPNTGFPIRNAIYGVYQDINPNVNNAFADPNINYQVLGAYPCRTLVVNFSEVAQFGGACQGNATIGEQTSQIVIYETTNVIEVYVERRVPCTAWQNGVGVIGIQNAAGTQALTPPGRNTGAWEAENEAWRFTPNGASIVTFEWLLDGAPISTETTIDVCPDETTTYVARATYLRCDGSTVVEETPATVIVQEPIPIEDPIDIFLCAEGDGPYLFDLTQNNDLILNGLDPDFYPISFHNSEFDADEGIAPIFPQSTVEAYPSDGDETIYVRIVDYNTDCSTYRSFQLIVSPAPTPGTPGDLQVCDVDNSGDEIIDLTVQDGDIYGGADPAIFTVTYYLTADDATNNDDPILVPDAYLATTGTIHARITSNTDENCYGVTSFEVTVTPTPEVTVPADPFVCSDTGYTLPVLAIGNYYTETGGTGTLLNEGDVISTTQTIFVYAESGTTPNNCTDEDSFVVTTYEAPVAGTPTTMQACDTDNGGDEIFDLTEQDGTVLNGLDPANFTVSYHATLTDAENNVALALPENYFATVGTTTLHVRISNNADVACYDLTSFDIIATPTPVVVVPADQFACSDIGYELPALAVGNYYT